MDSYSTLEEINAARIELEGSIDGYGPPAAYGVGVATVGPSGDVLDVAFPHVQTTQDSFPTAAIAKIAKHSTGTATYRLSEEQLEDAIAMVAPAESVDIAHPNLAAWRALIEVAATPAPGGERALFAAFIGNLEDDPIDAVDAYLRLHLLSHRLTRPHEVSVNGIFGKLTNVVWTNRGPFEVDGFESSRMRLRAMGHHVEVHLVDKFPRMLDYVVPSGVRIADGNRVRLGAHLAEGTTVMHEGFCNFNGGTLGTSMVEGRIGAGIVIGDGSDVGGGASIMGTLSGGGQEVVSVGKNCLLGANSGLGIALGDDCIVEAGLYLTAGTVVILPDGSKAKARTLSGVNGMLFRRNSISGAVEALARNTAGWQGLNEDLHANQ